MEVIANRETDGTTPAIGILSRTLVQTPVVRWIFPVRLRTEDQHEVALLGDDFIHIKQIDVNGQLRHLTTIDGFRPRIRSGGILGLEGRFKSSIPMVLEEEDIKVEEGLEGLPPQFMVVSTTEPPELHFLISENRKELPPTFHERIRPLPVLDSRMSFEVGSLIAVDPLSRAFAVAASRDNLIVYRVHDLRQLGQTLRSNPRDWDPVRDEQILKVNGTILRMHFLRPGPDDSNSIALVLVIGKNNRTSIQWFIWDLPEDDDADLTDAMRNADEQPYFQPLSQGNHYPHLLIPSRYAPSFIMIYHSYFVIANGAMTGQLTMSNKIDFGIGNTQPRFPAVSAGLPMWTGWTKATVNSDWTEADRERFYIAREDGEMYNFSATLTSTQSSPLGAFEGFLDQGFACCETDTTLRSPYFMICAGVMSPGEVKQLGTRDVSLFGDRDHLAAKTVDSLDNWSPVKDLVLTTLSPGPHSLEACNRTAICMTSGRGPKHGAVVTFNVGISARITTHFSIEATSQVAAIWTIEDAGGTIFIFLSLPEETLAFQMTADYEDVVALGVDEPCELCLAQPSLLVSAWPSGHVLQITNTGIHIYKIGGSEGDGLEPVLIRTETQTSTPDTIVVCVAARPEHGLLLLAYRTATGFVLRVCRSIVSSDVSGMTGLNMSEQELADIPSEPITVALIDCSDSLYGAVTTIDGELHIFRIGHQTNSRPTFSHKFLRDSDQAVRPNICESLSALTQETRPATFSLLCGMRDGTLVVLQLASPKLGDAQDYNDGGLVSIEVHTHKLGVTPIRLITDSLHDSSRVYAVLESTVLSMSTSPDSGAISFEEVIFTPKVQGWAGPMPIRGLSPILSSGVTHRRLSVVSGDTIMLASLDDEARPVVDRLALEESTPELVIYCERLSAFVVASTKIELAQAPVPNSGWRGRRTTYAQIEIISTVHALDDNGMPLCLGKFKLWPGERINAMLDWKFRDAKGTKRAQLVVATGFVAEARRPKRGRLLFLHLQKNEDGDAVDISPTKDTLHEEPVRHVTPYMDRDLIVATGLRLEVIRLDIDANGYRWSKVCRHELLSDVIHLTTEGNLIYVLTVDDSLTIFRLGSSGISNGHTMDGNDGIAVNADVTPTGLGQILEIVFTDSQARESLTHHLTLAIDVPGNIKQMDGMEIDDDREDVQTPNLVLLSDRNKYLTGLFIPSAPTLGTALPTLFEAEMPRSIVRIAQGPIRPPWRRPTQVVSGAGSVLADDLIGVSTDGELYQFSIIDHRAWTVLKVLEGAAKLKELVQLNNAGRILNDEDWCAATMMPTPSMAYEDKRSFHIDGDPLARHIKHRESLENLLRDAMQHERYSGLDKGTFGEAVQELVDPSGDCEPSELFERLWKWYEMVMMPIL